MGHSLGRTLPGTAYRLVTLAAAWTEDIWQFAQSATPSLAAQRGAVGFKRRRHFLSVPGDRSALQSEDSTRVRRRRFRNDKEVIAGEESQMISRYTAVREVHLA